VKWPISPIAGIAVIALYCIFTFSSWALYPTTYNPLDNWLSDLGNSTGNPRGAILYNIGCILTGIALFPLFLGLYKWYTDERWRDISIQISQAVGCSAAFALIMIGVFSEDSGSLHTLWSDIFFLLNLIVLIVMGASLFTRPKYMIVGLYGLAVAAINLAFVVASNTPILEWFTVFTALGFVGLLSYSTVKT
jgi:hypothetical membrane protein